MRSFNPSARHRSWMGFPLFLSFFLTLMLVASSLQGTWDVAYASHCGVGTGTGTGTGTIPSGSAVGTATGSSTATFRVVVSASPTGVVADGSTSSTVTAVVTVGTTTTGIANATVQFTSTLGTLTSGSTSSTASGSTRASVNTTTNSSGVATATLKSTTTGSATVDAVVSDTGGTARACPQTPVTFTSPPAGGDGDGAPAPAPTLPPTQEPGSTGSGTVDSSSGGNVVVGGGSSTDGGATVSFPPGAVSESTTVNVTVSNTAPANVTPPSGTTQIQYTLAITTSQPVTLSEPVTITINLTAAQIAAAGGNVNNVQVAVVLPNGSVEVLAVTVLNAGTGEISVQVTHFSKFTLFAVTKPGPTLTSPSNNSQLTGLGTTLTWTNPSGTTQYQIQVVPFNDDGPGINLNRNVETSYTVKAPDFASADPNYVMLPDITYLWRVRSTTSANPPAQLTEADWTAWSNPRTFRTGVKSSATISHVSPGAGAAVSGSNPTLVWSNSDKEVFYYEVQVSRDQNFSSALGSPFLYWELRHGGVTTPLSSYTIPSQYPLQAGATYYWRVRPRIQGDGEPVGWTSPRSFTTP